MDLQKSVYSLKVHYKRRYKGFEWKPSKFRPGRHHLMSCNIIQILLWLIFNVNVNCECARATPFGLGFVFSVFFFNYYYPHFMNLSNMNFMPHHTKLTKIASPYFIIFTPWESHPLPFLSQVLYNKNETESII